MKIEDKIKELKKGRGVYVVDFVKLSKYVTSISFDNKESDTVIKLRILLDDIYRLDEQIELLEGVY